MIYEITEAVPHPDHTVTVTWSDGECANVSISPFLEKGGVFAALQDPEYFVREMRVLPGGIGLAWPNEVDFSADGLRAVSDMWRRSWFGEEPDAALLLVMVLHHCATTKPDALDSHAIPANAEAMIALAEADYIALTGDADGRLFAVLRPEGRALIERHRFE